MNSGIVRFSELDDANTLDVLVWATSVPRPGATIWYEDKENVDTKEKISQDLNKARINGFDAKHVVIATWIDAQFSVSNEKLSLYFCFYSRTILSKEIYDDHTTIPLPCDFKITNVFHFLST